MVGGQLHFDSKSFYSSVCICILYIVVFVLLVSAYQEFLIDCSGAAIFGCIIQSKQLLFKWWLLLNESAISTNQSFSCFLIHSSQHCTLWEHRKCARPAGLSIPGPGALLLHQRLLAGANPDTMTLESIYESFFDIADS